MRVRIDRGAQGITLRTAHSTRELALEPPSDGVWRSAGTSLDALLPGERITLEAHGTEYRDYHVWIEREAAAAR